jgi:hypothetical protein
VEEAGSLEAIYQQYKDDGFILITMLTETNEGVPPGLEDLALWADEFGQTFPVLSDGDLAFSRFIDREGYSLPSHTLLSPGAEVLIAHGEPTDEDIEAALP